MPLVKHLKTAKNGNLFIWKINESVAQLLEMVNLTIKEQEVFNGFKSESRKKEFLAVRLLLQQNFDHNVLICHNQNGKPLLKNSNYHISITHTKNYAAIFLSAYGETALDMEYLSDRVEKIVSRFLSDKEQQHIVSENRILHLYQYWCTKECLIKFYGKKDIHLIKELEVYPFLPSDKTISGAVVRSDFNRKYTFHHLQIENCLLVYGEE